MKMRIYLIFGAALFASSFAFAKGVEGGGGGNALNGKNIETYAKPVTEIAGYSDVVAPALATLEKKLPQYAENLRDEPLSFYLVPRQLRQLGSDVTGLPFPSDQVAIQRNREVWIDSDLFDAMGTPKTRRFEEGKLLLHEIVLGDLLRIYQVSDVTPTIESQTRKITSLILQANEYKSKDLSRQLQTIIDPADNLNYDPIGFLGTADDKRAIYTAIQNVLKAHKIFCNSAQPYMTTSMNLAGMPSQFIKANLSTRDMKKLAAIFNVFAYEYNTQFGQLSTDNRTTIENSLFLLNPIVSNRLGLVAPVEMASMSSGLAGRELTQISCSEMSGENSPYYASLIENVKFPQSN